MNHSLHNSQIAGHQYTLLIVEDEESYREPLAYRFRREGFTVLTADTGERGLDAFNNYHVDIAILDVMLPGIDGFALCRAIRRQSRIPIIVVTAKDAEMDKVQGLEIGADDYVTKPYSFRELLARVHAVMRRNTPTLRTDTRLPLMNAGVDQHSAYSHFSGSIPFMAMQQDVSGILDADQSQTGLVVNAQDIGYVFDVGGIVLDTAQHIVTVRGEQKAFPLKEFELLEYLLRHTGLVVTRTKLIEHVWGTDYFGDTKTLDVHIKRIRAKIEQNPSSPVHVVTIRGLGYRFNSEEQIADLTH